MKILFMMRHYGYIGRYEEAIRQLADRGHEIHFAFNRLVSKPFDEEKMRGITAGLRGASYDFFPNVWHSNVWSGLALIVRQFIDYLRYLHPDFADCPKLAGRFNRRIPVQARFFFEKLFPFPMFWMAFFKAIESVLPVNRTALNYLQSKKPDIVLFTPLIDSNTSFIEFAKAAVREGVATVTCVASWDNLTNKGLQQIQTDRMLVWNETQKSEAVKYHAVRPETIIVTGAQTFDKWFDREPALVRADFLRRAGFLKASSYLLYVCSSRFIASEEVEFVKRWIERIRSCPELNHFGILIRPHPNHSRQWDNVDFEGSEITVYPRWPSFPYPFTDEMKQDYFDSLYYSEAVIGLNTSAMIEAGIVGRPVFSLYSRNFEASQQGTLHFRYLLKGGLVRMGKDLDEHEFQLVQMLVNGKARQDKNQGFIRDFVRPAGIDIRATPLVVQAIESAREGAGLVRRLRPFAFLDYFWRCLLIGPAVCLRFAGVGIEQLRKKMVKSPNHAGV